MRNTNLFDDKKMNKKQNNVYSIYDEDNYEDIVDHQSVETAVAAAKKEVVNNKPVILNPATYNGMLVNYTIIQRKVAEFKREDEQMIKELLEKMIGKQEPSKFFMRFSYFERFQREDELKNPPPPPVESKEEEIKEDIWIPLSEMPMLVNGEFY